MRIQTHRKSDMLRSKRLGFELYYSRSNIALPHLVLPRIVGL
jgi:hypothetical protein